MIDPTNIEYDILVNQKELRQIERKLKGNIKYEYVIWDMYEVKLTYYQVTATRRNKGKYSIFPKKYDERINESIKYNTR